MLFFFSEEYKKFEKEVQNNIQNQNNNNNTLYSLIYNTQVYQNKIEGLLLKTFTNIGYPNPILQCYNGMYRKEQY